MDKKSNLIFSVLIFGITFWQTEAKAIIVSKDISTPISRLSYTLGVDLGSQLHRRGIVVEPEILAQGLKDGLREGPFLLTDEQMEKELKIFHKNIQHSIQEEEKKMGLENKERGIEFLKENAKKTGVISLASGLQYRIIKTGKGLKPSDQDSVTVHYLGKLLDGSVFDSSYKTGQPVSFSLLEVIPGWTEILRLMNPGSEWEVYIPPHLAYGEQGIAGSIGPNETLIFRIELLSINHKKS